jgi:DNA-binding LacI/PurR family transcriptional regulator
MKNLNIFEVAALADVSIATISRVINNSSGVRKETRERVLAVLDKTNFRINAIAKQLRKMKSLNVAVIVSNIMKDFYSNIAKGIEDVAKTHNYSVFICNSGDDPLREREYLVALQEKRVDGAIITPTDKNAETINQLISFGIPVCFINRSLKGVNCDQVTVNNEEASVKAVSYLIESRYRKIGFISGARGNSSAQLRYKGYRLALKKYGVEEDSNLVHFGASSIESGFELAQKLFSGARVDAVFAANEYVGAGALHYLYSRGVRIGSDVGFIMWDDPFWATLLTPKLTVVSQPVIKIGTTAAELLFRRIEKEESGPAEKPVKVVFEANLIKRESV